MFARLKRTAITFIGVLAVFWTYRLLAVPLIEPHRQVKRVVSTASAGNRANAMKKQLENRLGEYIRYFPVGSWERDNPIVLESDSAKLLMQKYTTLPDGRLELMPCTVIYTQPQNGADQSPDHRRIVIMQSPNGAILEFDEPVDLGRGKLGRLVGAAMGGPITIQSGPTRPDGGDDFYATTHDVKMADNVISTPNDVDFRFGQSFGHGRNMRIELLPDESSPNKHSGVSASGIQSFELTNNVSMHLQPNSSRIMPGDVPTDSTTPTGGNSGPQQLPLTPVAKNANSQSPADIRCQGPFQFDLVNYIATFHDDVLVLRPSPIAQGPEDQMHCDWLSIFFASREKPGDKKSSSAGSTNSATANATDTAGNDGIAQNKIDPATGDKKTDSGSTTKRGSGKNADGSGNGKKSPKKSADDGSNSAAGGSSHIPQLEARRMEARGNPVIIHAPSNGLDARGLHFEYEPNRDGGQLGYLDSKGPGWLTMSQPQDPARKVEARWSQELKMRPQDDQHVLSVIGDAWVNSTGQGEISANAIHVWLTETMPAANASPNSTLISAAGPTGTGVPKPNVAGNRAGSTNPTGVDTSRIRPVKMMADGNVRMDSPQLTGAVQRLEAWFHDGPSASGPSGLMANATPQTGSGVPQRTFGGPAANAKGINNPAAMQREESPAMPQNPNGAPPAHYEVKRADLLQAWFIMPPRDDKTLQNRLAQQSTTSNSLGGAVLEHALLDGNVWFAQSATETQEHPLDILGDQVQVLHAENLSTTQAAVVGRPAQVSAQGMTMIGQTVQLENSTNRMWIEGPGRMTIEGKKTGDATATPQPARAADDVFSANRGTMTIDWQGSMNFDGTTARFERDVVGHRFDEQVDQTIRTQEMDAMLHRRIDFSQPRAISVSPGSMPQRAQVELVTCHGDVDLNSVQMQNGAQVAIDKMHVRELTVNQITGELSGQGPGRVLSWRKGAIQGLLPTAGAPGNAGTAGGTRPATTIPAGAASGTPKPAQPKDDEISFTDVQFQRGITGNVLADKRQMTFLERVRTLNGPVATWDAQLDADSAGGLAPRNMLVNCDQLTVSQQIGPHTAQRAPMEMTALGNIHVDGVQPTGTLFSAIASRLTYSEAKDMIVLEGDGRTDAQLLQQEHAGDAGRRLNAQKINYWRTSGQTYINGMGATEARFNAPPAPPKR